jgi:Family of unknown function (DUF6049)
VRKPGFAIAAVLTTSVIGLMTVLAGQLPATAASTVTAASTARAQAGSSVRVAITGMTPQWATARATVTVTGTVTNVSTESITDLSVQLNAGSSPLSSASVLEHYLASPYQLGGSPVTGQRQISRALKPGQSAHWTISFRAKAARLTTFGVYPLTAQVNAGATLDYAYTFLPYVPARPGKYAKSIPARKQVAWVWPLIDYPLIGLPDQRVCSGRQFTALHASLSPGGRLYDLLAAGVGYAQQVKLTWAVDPALLEDVRSLSRCEHAPGTAKAAADWLATLQSTTKTQPLFTTPYADIELSLIGQGHSTDVQRAFSFGRALAGQVLHRPLGATSSNAAAGGGSEVTTTAWPPSGTADNSTLGTLAAKENIQTLLLGDGSVPAGSGNAFVTATNAGGTARVLLYSDFLAKVLGAATSRPGSAFAAAQDSLAATALLAQSGTSGAIIVAPPRRWNPPDGLAQTVLSDTARAPWLQATPLAALEQAALEQHVTSRARLASTLKPQRFSWKVVHQFGVIDSLIKQISAIQATDQHFYLASTALQSSAWHNRSRAAQLAQISPLTKYMRQQQQGISLVVATRVTLGGLKGNVPVLIDNRLDYPVTVRLGLHWQQPPGGGLKVFPPAGAGATANVSGVITVPANGQEPVKIRVEAAQTGSTTLTVRLLNPSRQPLPTSSSVASVTVQATQFGNVAMIILASVLGVFVIASAIRGARRREPPAPDDTGGSGQLDPDAERASQEGPETDTVVPERSEQGTAGSSGL